MQKPADKRQCIGTDIQKGSSGKLRRKETIRNIILLTASKIDLYHFQLSDRTLLNQLFCFGKYRHMKNRHRLHQNQLFPLCQCHRFLQLLVIYRNRLFTKHMLAMLQCTHDIVIMVGMRCCDINDIHLFIRKQMINIVTVLYSI